MTEPIRIAIDGPAAAGKSTVAKIVARRLSYLYIDTGAMYRALTLKTLQSGMDPEDGSAVRELLENSVIDLASGTEQQTVWLDGEEVTDSIRTEKVSNRVSLVAKHKEVREEMVIRQRALAEDGGVVMDGRDVGTHILPHAEVKVFLSASVQIRAKRRYDENVKKGIDSDLKQMEADIALRDRRDSERETAPLGKAEDAIEVDTTSLSIEEAVDAIMSLVKERAG